MLSTAYTHEDYNKTIKRGFVSDDNLKLWSKDKRPSFAKHGYLDWRTLEDWHRADEAKKNNTRKVRLERRFILNTMKRERGCEVCGITLQDFMGKTRRTKANKAYMADMFARMIDFDHINPKEKSFNIGDKLDRCSWDVVLKEVDKCRTACKLCHDKHTGNQTRKV